MGKISTRELTLKEMGLMFPLINANNASVTKALFASRLAAMQKLGYRAIGIFEGKQMIGCSGFWLRTRFWSGLELDIDNFYVRADRRNRKLGAKMLKWFEAFARKNKVQIMVLDTYVDYFLAQRFYTRGGFSHTGFHMTKIPGSAKPFSRDKV